MIVLAKTGHPGHVLQVIYCYEHTSIEIEDVQCKEGYKERCCKCDNKNCGSLYIKLKGSGWGKRRGNKFGIDCWGLAMVNFRGSCINSEFFSVVKRLKIDIFH